LILVLLILLSQLSLPPSVTVARLYFLKEVLDASDKWFKIAGLEPLIILLDAIFHILVQLNGSQFSQG